TAQKSAEALECANEQDKFWEMYDTIFAHQQTMEPKGNTAEYTVNHLKIWAEEIGLNDSEFNECIDSGKYFEHISKEIADGENAGVQGVPTVFINGSMVVGSHDFAAFSVAIEKELTDRASMSP